MKFNGWVKHWDIVFLFTPKWVQGITLFPFIFIRPSAVLSLGGDGYEELVRHEQIHIRQQGECLVLPWYLLYTLNYLVNLIRFKKHFEAYYNICFEREAYQNQSQEKYLEKRRTFIWKKYFK